ncbi:MAG: hypothetical protein M3Y82_01025, partial [Verrucomicrobiota bacterium]|nr:hypothetical protein [Verrucomicrobiota bacterium]
MARWHSATVLNVTPEKRQVWQFSANNDGFILAREKNIPAAEPLPAKIISKDWHSLGKKKLNIAWINSEKVFLRVLQLPASDFKEILSMVELQLEKISPLPVAQIVWSIEILPQKTDNLQTVIVIIAARHGVEEFLGQLETAGYLADRLELPLLDQLLATPIQGDGVWIYPGETKSSPCLVAWWYGGVLRNATLINGGERFQEQVAQIAWAGEVEGWLTAPPRFHLVATNETATIWKPLLNQWTEQPVEIISALPAAKLAALSAQRAGRAELGGNLLPAEFTTRYHQQLVDRLWMGGLGALVMIYLIGVIIYFGALQVLKFQQYRVEKDVANISNSYTNAMQLKERVRILEEQANLKYAALDCWKAASDLLPQEMSLSRMTFQQGKT